MKIHNFFQKNNVIFIYLVLFLVPFFWFYWGEIDLGGDSTRIYFFDPLAWLKNVASYSSNVLSGLGVINPNFSMIPFSLFLFFLKILFLNDSYFLNCFFYGLLLSSGFLFAYLSINEISGYKNEQIEKCPAIIGGLFFIFSPIIIYEWQRAGWFIHEVLVYPMIFYLFLRYVNYGKYRDIVIGVIVTFIFSLNFSFSTAPWFFAFFPFAFLFLFFYAVASKKTFLFLKGFCLFVCLFVCVQFFQIFPQLSEVFNQSSQTNSAIFSKEGIVDRGFNYFLSVQPYTRLIYTITNQPQYDITLAFHHPQQETIFGYGIKYQYLFFVYILIVLSGALVIKKIGFPKDKTIYVSLIVIFLVLIFFITANINDTAVEFYKSLFLIPGFAMFRSFYTKFNLVFIFFYALLLAISLQYLVVFIKNRFIKGVIYLFLLVLIIFNAWPLISGKISNEVFWQSKNITSSIKINSEFLSLTDDVKNKKLDNRYVSFPLTGEAYQILQGQDGGVYFGPSFTSILTGKNDLNGILAFSVFDNDVGDMLKEKDYISFEKILLLMNVGKIIHNSDDYIYDNFPAYPYSGDLKNIFPDQKSISDYIQNLNYSKDLQIGDNFNLYSAKDNFLPHFYTPQNSIISQRTIKDLPKIISSDKWQTRSAVFFNNQNLGKENILKQIQDDTNKTLPVLEFKKINPTKYRVRVHFANGKFPLVFSESFHDGWKTYLASPSQGMDSRPHTNSVLKDYKILDGNIDDQATKEELQNYISSGYVTVLGDQEEKMIKHKKWENNKEKLDYTEKYNIDFISKNFQGTIQNDNLPNGNIFETWLKNPIEHNKNHLMANGYANSWVIDTEKMCDPKNNSSNSSGANCVRNPDGSYDFEMIVEFWPQRLFYIGLGISGLTLLGCVAYLGYDWRKRKNPNIWQNNLKNDKK